MYSVTFQHPAVLDEKQPCFLAASLRTTDHEGAEQTLRIYVTGPFQSAVAARDEWTVDLNRFEDRRPYYSFRAAVSAAHELAANLISSLNWGYERQLDELPY